MGYIWTLYQLNEAAKKKNAISRQSVPIGSITPSSSGGGSYYSSGSGGSSSSVGGGSSSNNSNITTKKKEPTLEEQSIAAKSNPERNAYLGELLTKNLRDGDLGKVSSILDPSKIGDAVNQASKHNEGANNIIVMTKDDNLTHNYFHYFECWWDANNCLSGVIIKMPKSETENTKYWINYRGQVLIYMGNNVPNAMYDTVDEEGTTNNNKYWDLKGMYPFFQGTVTRIKEKQDELEIHVDSIGRRFKAKIPKEFREAFIYNQNVRDAFQAICEFLGVYYICPPQTEVEDEEEEEESATKDGTENDVNGTLNKENQMAAKATKKAKKKKKKSKSSSSKRNKTTQNSNANTSIENIGAQNSNDPNANQQEEEQEDTEEEDSSDVQTNGYADISFDSGGSIVHGQKVIETSPDMAQTLQEITENPLLHGNYDEEGSEYIIEDVGKLLRGEMFEELHNEVMNYDSITIEPKSSASSDMSTTGTTPNNTNNQNNNQNNNKNNNKSGNSSSSSDGEYNYVEHLPGNED